MKNRLKRFTESIEAVMAGTAAGAEAMRRFREREAALSVTQQARAQTRLQAAQELVRVLKAQAVALEVLLAEDGPLYAPAVYETLRHHYAAKKDALGMAEAFAVEEDILDLIEAKG
jgi:hypothetical protein